MLLFAGSISYTEFSSWCRKSQSVRSIMKHFSSLKAMANEGGEIRLHAAQHASDAIQSRHTGVQSAAGPGYSGAKGGRGRFAGDAGGSKYTKHDVEELRDVFDAMDVDHSDSVSCVYTSIRQQFASPATQRLRMTSAI